MSNMEIIEAIKSSASQHNNPDNYMGWGIPDFMAADSLLNSNENSKPVNFSVTLFPNPCKEKINIRFSKPVNMDVTYSLKDLMGRILFNQKINPMVNTEFNLSLSLLSQGIYLMEFDWNDNKKTIKIIKE